MPYEYDQQSGKFRLTVDGFEGGLNTRDIDSKIRENELSAIRDFSLEKRGALSIRPGYESLFSSEAGTDAIMSQGGYYKTGATSEHIFTSGTDIYTRTAGTVTTSAIKTGLTGDGLVFDMHQFYDKYFMGNGIDEIQVYDGSAVHDFGYPIPDNGVTAAEGDAGLLENKEYQYEVTFYYEDGESNPSGDIESITPTASHKVNLSAIPTGGTRVTQRKLYRTTGDGSTFKLLTTLNDNTTTVYVDNTPDAGLGADMDEDNDYSYMEECKYLISHKGRLWGAGHPDYPSRVFYTKALVPESNPALYYWDIGSNDGDIITCLEVNLGALIIFKRYSTWVITGDDPTGTDADMVLEKVNPSIGTASRKSVAHAGNDLLFLSPSQGVHRLHRIILATSETMDTEAISDKIRPTIDDNMEQSGLGEAHAVVHKHKYYLYLASLNQAKPNRALVLELSNLDTDNESRIAWTHYYNQNFYSSCIFRHTDGEHHYVGHNTNGFCYEFGTSSSDDGQAIQAYATSKYFDMGSFGNFKTGRDLFIRGRASEDYSFTMRLFVNEADGGTSTETQVTEDFTGGGTVSGESVMFDEALFDDVLYDSDGSYTSVVVDILRSMEINASYNLLKIKIEDVSANQEFKLYGYELIGYLGGMRQQG